MTSLCRHILPAGRRCTQPAVNNSLYCRHHQVVKVTLAKVAPKPDPYKFHHPLPFVFTEDRAGLQINYSLVIAALNDKRIDVPTANAFNRLLRSCEMSLRRGPLHETTVTASREKKPRLTRRNPNEKWLVDDEDDSDSRDSHDSQPAMIPMVERVILTPAGEEIAPACDLLDEEAGESHGQCCPCQRCSEEFRNAPPEPHHRQCECGLCVLTADVAKKSEAPSDPVSDVIRNEA